MATRYRVTLTKEERRNLAKLSTTGKRAARKILHARAILLVDAGELGPRWKTTDVATAVGLSARTIENLKKRFVEEGLDAALERKPRVTPPRPVQFDGRFEARLLSIACSEPPPGRKRWTVRLLAEKLVELEIVPNVSHMTVHNTLKKMKLSLT